MSTEKKNRFESLMDEHRKIVYKICTSYCPDAGSREDLAQEIVTELWRSFGTFDDRGAFSTWMYRVALNVAISFNRREATRARHVVLGDEHLLVIADDAGEPEELLLLRGFIDGLDPLNKGLILLFLDGYSYREIAGVLGISETNVATKLGRLKAAMKLQFSGNSGGVSLKGGS
jgi:RNA polymerase sigma factor (sigma-70 family)